MNVTNHNTVLPLSREKDTALAIHIARAAQF